LVKIGFVNEPENVSKYFRKRLGCFETQKVDGVDILVGFTDAFGLRDNMLIAGDKDKLTVAYNKDWFCILNYDGKVAMHAKGFQDCQFIMHCENSVNVCQLFDLLMMFLIQPILLSKGATLVHGSAVSLGNKGMLTTGWRDIGKTTLMMRMVRDGASYMSDDLAIVHDDKILGLPMPLNVTERHLKEFNKKMPWDFRRKKALRKFGYFVGRCLQKCPSASLSGAGQAICQLVSPSILTREITHLNFHSVASLALEASLDKVFFLSRACGDRLSVSNIDAVSLANAMMKSLVYEMDVQVPEVYQVFRFAFPTLGQRWMDNRERGMVDVLVDNLQKSDNYAISLPYEHNPDGLYNKVRELL
jgi:hypothetical protein